MKIQTTLAKILGLDGSIPAGRSVLVLSDGKNLLAMDLQTTFVSYLLETLEANKYLKNKKSSESLQNLCMKFIQDIHEYHLNPGDTEWRQGMSSLRCEFIRKVYEMQIKVLSSTRNKTHIPGTYVHR